jgi:hypothetical protein
MHLAVVGAVIVSKTGKPLPLCFVDYKAGEERHWLSLHPRKSGE